MKNMDARTSIFSDQVFTAAARFRPVFANAIVIGFVLVLYKIASFPGFSISDQAWNILALLALVYLIGFALSAFVRQSAPSKGELMLAMFGKLLLRQQALVTAEEKHALLVTFLKVYFVPLMIAFFIEHMGSLQAQFTMFTAIPDWRTMFSIAAFNTTWYPFLFVVLIMIDVAYFTFGYIVDHAWFRNTIRSIDQTFLGWAVALACYPPFNASVSTIIGSYGADTAHAYAGSLSIFAFNVLALFLFSIYVWATLALGAKCSNLTNRGIVSHGPYAFVRHPAYASKNAVWILSVLPLGILAAYVSVFIWVGIYYLRAVTEEKHLSQDPDYLKYKSQVPWLFIPRVW
jgi:protein-S-isoprenylcysteine O-methyltransferase Ste14